MTLGLGRPPGQPRTGGRKPGVPNRITREILEKLEELGCDPIEGMAKLAMDPKNTPELRGKMYAELASFAFPKRKAVDLSGPGGGPLQVQVVISDAEPSPDENAPA